MTKKINMIKMSYLNLIENNIINLIYSFQNIFDRQQLYLINKKFYNLFMNYKNKELLIIPENKYKLINIFKYIKFYITINKDISNNDLIKYKNINSLLLTNNTNITNLYYIRDIYQLDIYNSSIIDLTSLRNIVKLYIPGCNNIKYIPPLKKLKLLDASYSGINIIHFLESIEELYISFTNITDISHLYKCKKIKMFEISMCNIPNYQINIMKQNNKLKIFTYH